VIELLLSYGAALEATTEVIYVYKVGQKMAPFIVHLIASPNINRFLKFFHCGNQETICNETVAIG